MVDIDLFSQSQGSIKDIQLKILLLTSELPVSLFTNLGLYLIIIPLAKNCAECEKKMENIYMPKKLATCTKKPAEEQKSSTISVESVQKATIQAISTKMVAADVKQVITGRESLRKYVKRTRDEALTSSEDAPEVKRKRSHSSRCVNVNLDVVKGELDQLVDNYKVNWTQLAKKHGLDGGNCGQVLKEKLTADGYNTQRFWTAKVDRKRRKGRKVPGTSFSMPKHASLNSLNSKINELVDDGQLHIGTEFEISSHQIFGYEKDFDIIRKKALKQEIDLGIRRNANETCERYWKIWTDSSTVANAVHMLVCITRIYDSKYYLTPHEVHSLTGKNIDVQKTVESPEIYLLARCPSTYEKMSILLSRVTDNLSKCTEAVKVEDQITYDVFKCTISDNAALWSEFGISHNGKYCCPGCQADSSQFGNNSVCYRVKPRTAEEIVSSAKFTTTAKSLSTMKKGDLQKELKRRGMKSVGTCDAMKESIRNDRRGVDRVPGWLNSSTVELHSSALANIEIPAIEPLHCLKGHIENIFKEFQNKRYGNISEVVSTFWKLRFEGKQILRGRDYRNALNELDNEIRGNDNISKEFRLMVTSLADIAYIMYMDAYQRNAKTILQLYGKTFIHALLLDILVGRNPATMTGRKFYGLYYHQIVKHAPLVYRLLALSSINAEQEEQQFKSVKNITSTTSNFHIQNILRNFMLRNAAEIDAKKTYVAMKMEEKGREIRRTVLETIWFERRQNLLQSFLEQIADYLIVGTWTEISKNKIEFKDSSEGLIQLYIHFVVFHNIFIECMIALDLMVDNVSYGT